ncbi:DUF6634 family protein [Methylobacterium sp. D54C]
MLIAFFSTGANAANAHASLLAAHALACCRGPVTLARARTAGVPSLPVTFPDHVRLIEMAPVPDDVTRAIGQGFERGGQGRMPMILDLPVDLLRNEALRDRVDAAVVTVGASPLDEMLAASVLAPTVTTAVLPAREERGPWLLGCDRPNHASAALQFERAMREAVPGRRDGCPGARFLPAILPTPSPAEAAALLAGTPGEVALRRGLKLLGPLMPGAGMPSARPGSGERLREVAEALDAMAGGRVPSDERLSDAPLLEDWSIEARAVPSLTGYVTNHHVTGRGRWPLTVDIYATDGRSWARTYSRYYRLGRPAGSVSPRDVRSMG